MLADNIRGYIIVSFILHIALMLSFILGFESVTPLAVVENTNKQDVISAVVLGDSATSKILPQQIAQPIPQKTKPEVKPDEVEKNKLAQEKKMRELMEKELLISIKQQRDKQKKVKQKQLQAQFKKLLRAQTEQSLRHQFLN